MTTSLKIQHQKELHVYRGEKDFNSLKIYIKKSFSKVPEKFWLKYTDEDNDEITISCTEDIISLLEMQKPPKLQICEISHSSESTESFEQIQKVEIPQNNQNQQKETPKVESPKINQISKNETTQDDQNQKNPDKETKKPEVENFFGQIEEKVQSPKMSPKVSKIQEQAAPQDDESCVGCKPFLPPGIKVKCKPGHKLCVKCLEKLEKNEELQKPEEIQKPKKETDNWDFLNYNKKNIKIKQDIKQEPIKKEKKTKWQQSTYKKPVQIQQKQKVYSDVTMIKAKTVSEVMGGNQKTYLGVCEFFNKFDVDYIVGKIVEDPTLVQKHTPKEPSKLNDCSIF